ncbi:hypothetical protein DFH07DRAFT_1001364 [Mycena maculata]|uniref:Uncharacterized protein n=1 Tax=Mycena maculata TaxID=230809 RepID=A0AAD7NQR9_9AGAR|nr:hypothetical protein DFH07DRAFT_1001364 [Mycena maculata]
MALQQRPADLELCIRANFVGVYQPPPTIITSDELAAEALSHDPPLNTDGFIHLLSGPLDDFLQYAQEEHSKWLMDIAHDICDPLGMRGNQDWCPVDPTDPLTASLYRYDVPDGITIGLSKISPREGKCKTADAVTMRTRVISRDGECWVCGALRPLKNSHLCPKRMGDHLARRVFHDFSPGSPANPNLSVFDEILGITLGRNHDIWFSKYELGFRFVSANLYRCHVFASLAPNTDITLWGGQCYLPLPSDSPRLHGYPVAPPQPHRPNNPPAALIRWHYLQCVLQRFAHADYTNFGNIRYPELPLRMERDSDDDDEDTDSDDDDEGTDSEAEWPTAWFDRALQAQMEAAERHDFTANWVVANEDE